jgi:hypothetical protein
MGAVLASFVDRDYGFIRDEIFGLALRQMKNFVDFATYSASKAASYSITLGLRDYTPRARCSSG